MGWNINWNLQSCQEEFILDICFSFLIQSSYNLFKSLTQQVYFLYLLNKRILNVDVFRMRTWLQNKQKVIRGLRHFLLHPTNSKEKMALKIKWISIFQIHNQSIHIKSHVIDDRVIDRIFRLLSTWMLLEGCFTIFLSLCVALSLMYLLCPLK